MDQWVKHLSCPCLTATGRSADFYPSQNPQKASRLPSPLMNSCHISGSRCSKSVDALCPVDVTRKVFFFYIKKKGNKVALLHFNHQMVSSITMQRQMREEGGREVLQMEPALSIFINTSNSDPLKTPTEINWGDAWLRQASRLLGQDCRSICWEFIALFVVGGLRGFGCAWNTLWYSLAFNHASSLSKIIADGLGVGLRRYTC